MSLYTGREIHGYVWNELPISDEVTDRVDELARKSKKACKLINRTPLFKWSPGVPIVDRPLETDEQENDNKM